VSSFIRHDARIDLGSVQGTAVAWQIPLGPAGPRFFVKRTKNNRVHARTYRCARTHCARFKSDHQGRAIQPPPPQPGSRSAQSYDLGVGGGVPVSFTTIPPPPHNFTVHHNDSANRNIATGGTCAGFV